MPLQKIDQQRISLVAGAILVTVAIFVGVMVFYIMEHHAEHLLSKNLQASLQNNVEFAKSEIRHGFERGVTVATRPFLIEQIQRVNTHNGGGAALQGLNRGAQSFLATGLSAVALFGKDGQEITLAGNFVQQPALITPIGTSAHMHLLFKDKFFCALT